MMVEYETRATMRKEPLCIIFQASLYQRQDAVCSCPWRARKCIPLQNYIHDSEFDWILKLLFDYGHFVLLSGRPSISMNLILFPSLNSQCTPRKQYGTTDHGIITHHMPKAIPRPVKESLSESTIKYADKEEELLGHCKLGIIPYDELSAATAAAAARERRKRGKG